MNINWDSQSLVVLGFTGVLFLVMGLTMHYFPPKKINFLYGYRTNSSMSSQEKWDFAQRYWAVLMAKSGVLMSILGLLISVLIEDQSIDIILSTPTLLIIVGFLFFKTERAITKKFGKNQIQK